MILIVGMMAGSGFTVRAEEGEAESQATEEILDTEESEEQSEVSSFSADSEASDEEKTQSATEQSETSSEESDTEETAEDEEITLFGVNDTEAAGASYDDPTLLANYVKTLTINVNGEPKTADTEINDGDDLEVILNWQIPGEVYAENKTYYYQLPVTFLIEEAISDNIMQGDDVVGTFRVDTDGLVTLTYNSDYNSENNVTANSMGITGNAVYRPEASEDETKLLYEDGSETIVVLSDGDFTVTKKATKVYEDDRLSRYSVIEYTVEIYSEQGTNGDFSIEDILTLTGDFASVAYDAGSFRIVDEKGDTVTGWTKTVNEDSFTIKNLPELSYGKSYILTYHVNVAQKINKNTTEKVANKVTVSDDDDDHSASTTVTYDNKTYKKFNSYNQNTGMLWDVYIYTRGTDMSGYILTDAADAEIDFSTITVYRMDAGANQLSKVTPTVVQLSDRSFQYVLPEDEDYEKVSYIHITYRTKVDFGDETSVTTNNTITLEPPSDEKTDKDEGWSYTGVGTATKEGRARPTKSAEGVVDENDDYVTMNWSLDVSFDNLNTSWVFIDDEIQAASYYYDATYNHWWDSTAYASDHYGIAADLNAQLSDSLIITVEDESGRQTDLTLSEARALGYTVSLIYYKTGSRSGTASDRISASDTSSHVKSFSIYLKAPEGTSTLNVTRVRTGTYSTYLSKEHIVSGVDWKVTNAVKSMDQTSSVEQAYSIPKRNISKMIYGVDSSGNRYWTEDTASFDYDKVKGTIRYRIVVTVDKNDTSVTITDQIPEGLTLVTDGYDEDDGSTTWGYYNTDGVPTRWVQSSGYVSNWKGPIAIGPYTGVFTIRYNNSDQGWSDANRAENISIDEDDNTLTVQINNLRNVLKLTGSNQIAIEYECEIDEDLEALGGYTQTVDTENNQVTITKTLTNTASYGNLEDSVDAVITQEKDVLSKYGDQQLVDGALSPIVHYEVDINDPELDLLAGSDTLKLTDTIESEDLYFELVRSSIKLYLMTEDGEKGEEVRLDEVSITQPEEDEDGTVRQSFTITIADETSYILAYDYRVTGAKSGSSGTLSNVASLEGVISTSADEDVSAISAWATSDHGALRLYKVDARNNTQYISATFTLEKYDKATNSFVTVEESFDVSGSAGKRFEYYAADCQLEGNTLYRVVETKAQSGYELSADPLYFIIKGNIEDVRADNGDISRLVILDDADAKEAAYGSASVLGSGENAVTVSDLTIHMLAPNKTASFDIENERTPIKVTVVKEWKDGLGLARPESVTVQLYSKLKSDTDGTTAAAVGDPIELSADEDWTYVNEELPGTDEDFNELTYYVVEVGEADGTIELDASTYKVTYEVDEETNTITVTNKLLQSVEMPETGGTPMGNMLLVGLVLIAASLLYFTKRRRIV